MSIVLHAVIYVLTAMHIRPMFPKQAKTTIPHKKSIALRVGELLMGIQDVEFLPSRASLSITFLKNCGRGEGHRTTTCPKTVVGGKQGNAPSKIILLHKASLCQLNFMDIVRLSL